jgi:hypothetical protein
MAIDNDCDCSALERWKQWGTVLSITCVIAITSTIVLGWSAARMNYDNAVLRERMTVTPEEVLDRLQVTPADVMQRVEKIERDLAIKPKDVLAEVKAMRAELKELKTHIEP